MAVQTIGFRFVGIAPLLMHNGALANPLNPLVKEMKAITGLRKKTDEHHLELQRLEFRASLYLDAKGRVIVPSSNIEGTLVEGAKKAKLGKAFKSAVMVADDAVLNYGAQLTIDELWTRAEEFADVRAVIVNNSRVMRTRPIFRDWSIEFTADFDDEQINGEQLVKAAGDAGRMVGLLDFRPKFGRFDVTVL